MNTQPQQPAETIPYVFPACAYDVEVQDYFPDRTHAESIAFLANAAEKAGDPQDKLDAIHTALSEYVLQLARQGLVEGVRTVTPYVP